MASQQQTGVLPPINSVLPPLILGTATFNTQYHPNPSQMPYRDIVRRALLDHKITAFDTSPYYGPSEVLLGDALSAISPSEAPRSSYQIVTKVGRIAGSEFDYSAAWVRYSIGRSCKRLRTDYLDLVYAHDVEFVSKEEVLEAVTELRRLRDEEGVIRYVGISGYPVETLTFLASYILEQTGEPVDAILSYGHYTLQNSILGQDAALEQFKKAKVGCVLNASMLGMGLLTTRGVDRGPMASWHPAPSELRAKCDELTVLAEADGEKMEDIAIRWSIANWAKVGADFGSVSSASSSSTSPIGISVMGVSAISELDETQRIFSEVALAPTEQAVEKAKTVEHMKEKMDERLGEWKDYAWTSGGADFVNERSKDGMGVIEASDVLAERFAESLGAVPAPVSNAVPVSAVAA